MAEGLEVRRGYIEPISTSVEVSGGEHVSSVTVTIFELDGRVVQYRGGALPVRPGDEATVVGRENASGIFEAHAVRLPRTGVVMDIGDGSMILLVVGAVFLAVGALALIGALGRMIAADGVPHGYAADLFVVTILLFMGAGFSVVGGFALRQGRNRSGSIARAMLGEADTDRAGD